MVVLNRSQTSIRWPWQSIRFGIQQLFDLIFQLIGKLEAIAAKILDSIILDWIMTGRDHYTSIGSLCSNQVGNARRSDDA